MRVLQWVGRVGSCWRRWLNFVVLAVCASVTLWAQLPTSPIPSSPLPQSPSHLPPMPDTNAPNTASTGEHKSNREVTEKLQKALHKKNAAYADSNIQPVVNDQNITLNGTVRDEGQREMALQLARAYAGNRQVVDRLSIQP